MFRTGWPRPAGARSRPENWFSFPRSAGHNHRIQVTEQTHDGFRWRLADDFAPLLPPLLRGRPTAVIKDDRAKFVGRYEVDGRAFYVKRYRHGAFGLRPLKYILKRSPAEQEWRLARVMEARHLPIVRHVALGERWTLRGLVESVLITEAFDGVPIERQHEPFFPLVNTLVQQLARGGVTHYDLHPANLLLNEARQELRLIDLYGAKIQDRASRDDLRDVMLTQLCVSLPLPVNDDVRRMSRVLRRDKLAERSRRCLKSNRDFAARSFDGLRWQYRRAALAPAVESILRDPDGFLARARVLKAGRSATVGAADGLVLKRHNFRKLLNPIKDLFRGSRGRRDFHKAYHLELCELPTAQVLATADRRILGLPVRSYVLMRELADAMDAAHAPDEDLVNLAQLLAWLHTDGFTHRDLKETNILFDANGVPHLIDLDGLKFVKTVPMEETAANLRRLALGLHAAGKLTRSNTIRFLHAYCRERGVFPRAIFPSDRRQRRPAGGAEKKF